MSYIDYPRLSFSGRFRVDPSTVNNTPSNYDPKVVNPTPNWYPKGDGSFNVEGCTVTQLTMPDASLVTEAHSDPLIGSALVGSSYPSGGRISPKMVNLDTEQQVTFEIFGFALDIQLGGVTKVSGSYSTAPVSDLWLRGVGTPNDALSATYQSTMTDLKWADDLGSPFLEALKTASPHSLSIGFVIESYHEHPKSPYFLQGRIAGTIGPQSEDEPGHLFDARILRPPFASSEIEGAPLYFAFAKLHKEKNKLSINLGNSLPTKKQTGDQFGQPLLDNGPLYLAYIENINTKKATIRTLGSLEQYRGNDWYEKTAGVVDFDIPPEMIKKVESTPLAIVQGDENNPGVYYSLIQENSDGTFLKAEESVFRLYPGDTAETRIYAYKFGAVMEGALVETEHNTQMLNQIQCPANQLNIETGIPRSALAIANSNERINSRGFAKFTFSASSPGNPRGFIDGQVYGVSYKLHEETINNLTNAQNPLSFLSFLVWDECSNTDTLPTWEADIKPILSQFAKLYPVMAYYLDMSNYGSVYANLEPLKAVFSLEMSNPAFMPVTRDLSTGKINMILNWINNGAPEK